MTGRIGLTVRGAATTPVLSIFLVVVIAVLSYLGVAAPTLLAEGRTATVQRAVISLPDLAEWPSATAPGPPAPGAGADPDAGVWGGALATLEDQRKERPEPLRSLLGTPRMTVTIGASTTSPQDGGETVPKNKVALVSDPGLEHRARIVEGRLPHKTVLSDGVEIVLTPKVAEQLQWPVGTDRQWGGMTATLTGTVEPSGTDDGDWVYTRGALAPAVEMSPSGDRTLIAAGFMHADEAAEFLRVEDDTQLFDIVSAMSTTVWMPFDDAALDARTAAKTASQLRLLSAAPFRIPMFLDGFDDRGQQLHSSLPQAIDEGLSRGDAMTAVIAVAAVGPIAVAIVVLALVSRLIAVRRVAPTRVLRARGASTGRLVALLGSEGAALGLLGAAIGAGAAAAVPGWVDARVLLIPAILAAVPAFALPWGALTDAHRLGRRDLGQAASSGGKLSRGLSAQTVRFVLEMLVLVVTAALAVLILTRPGAGDADPLLLAMPVLLGLSGSILALRLLPVLLNVAEQRGRRSASLSSLLGPARARRDPVVRTAPVLAVVVGVGIAVFSVAFASTVTQGIVRAAENSVGADLRVVAPHITDVNADGVAGVDGVAHVAKLRGNSSVSATAGPKTARVRVYVMDREELAAVQGDSDAALHLPEALAAPAGDAVPVVASEKLLDELGLDSKIGAEFEVSHSTVRAVGVAPSQVPFGAAEQWVIVDPVNAEALGQRSDGVFQIFIALAPGADADTVGEKATALLGGGAEFETPEAVTAVRAADPGFTVVQGALLAASGIVAVLLAIAVIATMVLGGPSRARMLAILRTLGQSRRGAGRLVAWEVAPALLMGVPFGALMGIVMAWLVIPQLDLRGFVGAPVQPPVLLGGVWPWVIVLGFAALVGVAIVVAAALASRLGSADAIRTDDEERS